LLRIGKEFADEMIAHSQEENPDECCGILSGADDNVAKLYRIKNATPSPYRYSMEPQEFLEAMLDSERNEWEMLAFYHSHTHSPAYPSQTDVRLAVDSWMLDVLYILVSLEDTDAPQIRAFQITEASEILEKEFKIVCSR
jgi:proteasome lid subunit RPN8/RPN11|tara:strand:+ start:2505 stop:2924 length:420 start_codon:yes stop_codon:yes gene_type:complete